MLKYLEFISESVTKLTLPYYYSKRFRDLLMKISSKKRESSAVADFLLSAESANQVEDDITFIDITDINDMISFIQTNRIKRVYDKEIEEHPSSADVSWEEFVQDMASDEGGVVWKNQRTELSIGRFLTRVCLKSGIKISDTKKESFVNAYKSAFDLIKSGESNFELVNGGKIKHWYLVDNYEKSMGQLGNSCMKGRGCQNFFNIYTENPEQVSLLILKSEDNQEKIVGRALVWKLSTGEYFLDRIYTISDSDSNLFLEYSKKRNWRNKDNTSYTELNKFTVNLEKWMFDFYPYMDTFCCLNSESGVLSADEDKWPNTGWWKLRNTDGSYDKDNVIWSNYHEEYIDRDDAIYCEGSDDYVMGDSAIYLNYKDRYASPSEDTTLCYDGENYYSEDTVYSEYLNSSIYEEEAIEIVVSSDEQTDWICDEISNSIIEVELSGELVKTLPVFVTQVDGTYYFKDAKIGGESVINYIIKSNQTVSHEELERYILENDFEIEEHKKLYESVTLKRNNRDDLSILRAFPSPDLTNMIKCMLIISPDRNVRRKDGNNRPIVSNWPDFKQNLLKPEKNIKLIDELISDQMKKTLLGAWHADFAYKCVVFSDEFAPVLLKDPKMLATWYKWKVASV